MNEKRRSNQAWTLVEVLVVFAILALLIALFGPAARMMQEQAAGVRCAANLRQIGVGLSVYTQDKGVFPYYIDGSIRWFDGKAEPKSFFAGPYLNHPPRSKRGATVPTPSAQGGLFDCPAIQTEHKKGLGQDEWIEDFFDYGMNISLCGRTMAGIPQPSKTVAVVEGGHYARVKAQHTAGITYTPGEPSSPGGTAWNWGETNGGSGIIIYRHRERANFLFVDGHVGRHQQEELSEEWFNAR